MLLVWIVALSAGTAVFVGGLVWYWWNNPTPRRRRPRAAPAAVRRALPVPGRGFLWH